MSRVFLALGLALLCLFLSFKVHSINPIYAAYFLEGIGDAIIFNVSYNLMIESISALSPKKWATCIYILSGTILALPLVIYMMLGGQNIN